MSQVYEETLEVAGQKFSGRLVKLENAVLVFLDMDSRFRLGTLAVGMPELGGVHHISSILMGDRNIVLAKILAERLSATTKKIALVSVHLGPLLEPGSYTLLLKLSEKLVERALK